LAWPVRPALGEHDFPTIYTHPSPVVLTALRGASDILELCRHGLPTHL
jgi:hypothetical protein